MSTTKTVPPPTPLRFSLQLDRTYTEMTLAKAEGSRARAELYDLLKKVLEDYHQHKNNKDSLADSTLSVDIYEVSQRFSSDHLKAAFKQQANNGTAQQHQLLDGALLKTVVQVMGQKAIFGQNAAVDTEKYVFEIFDEYAQDYVTLCHLESPVPNGARLRIKLNAIQDVFSYEESSDHHNEVIDSTTCKSKTATIVDHSKNSKPKKKVEEEKTEKGTELKVSSHQQQQSQTKSVYHTAKSTKFPSSSFSNNSSALNSSVTQKKAALGKGKKGNKKRNKRRGNSNNNNQQQQLQQQYSSNVACHQKPSLPPLSRAQVHMFKDIFKALESEAVLEEIERQAGFLLAELADKEDEEDEGGDNKEKKNADKKGTASKKQQHLFQHLIAHLWKCVVGQVASLPTSAADRAVAPAPGYLGAQYQQLYHLVVCVHYLDALARANSYLEAAAIFELFSFVHGKVLTPYFRLEDYFTGYKEEKKDEEKDEEDEDEDEDIEGHQDGDNGPLKNSQSQEFPNVHCVCLCGVCGLTTGALIAARAAFCDKQVVLVVTQDDFEDFEGDDHKEEKEEEEEDFVVLMATEEDKAGSPEVGDQK